MAKLPTIDQFAGDWTIERTIDDRMHGQNGQLQGGARIEPGGLEGGYIYREAGKLALEGGTEMEALRVYLWGRMKKASRYIFKTGAIFT